MIDLNKAREIINDTVHMDGLRILASQLCSEIELGRTEIERLRETLGFYADRENWIWEPTDDGQGSKQEADLDHGYFARAALGEKK